MPATTSASVGATSAGMMTFSSSPSPYTALAPWAANAAPTTPPIRACELEAGRPKYQVARFQAIAPISPANTISGVIRLASTMPEAIVAATCSDRNAPTKFRVAASATARRGVIARVEIEVATALAVSWKPLVKSKASAVATTIQRMTSEPMPYWFLITMPSRMFATVSAASIPSSRRSKMSFQRITSIGSMPRSNSDARASRSTRSPSFSRRLISTV